VVSNFPAETAGLLGIGLSIGAGPMSRSRKERFLFCLHSVVLWVFKRVARPRNWPHQIWCHLFRFSVPPCRLKKNPFERSPLSLSPPPGDSPPVCRAAFSSSASCKPRARATASQSSVRAPRSHYLKRRSHTPPDPPPSYNVESVSRFVVHYS
jgi:hypothetical protein